MLKFSSKLMLKGKMPQPHGLTLNVSNFILHEMDGGNVTAMLLLDLSSAFDTVNHTILLNTLMSFGVKGQAYHWFKSYLSCHSQIVCINRSTSNSAPLTCGVPRGSVGGPTLFSIYLIGLQHILQRYSVHNHIYADDIQLFVSFKPNQADAARTLRNLEACANDIHDWLSSHSLKLNHAKSEFLLFGSKTQLNKIDVNSIAVAGNDINVSQSCRNLGIMFDSNMTMSDQIQSVCKSVRYQLRNLGFIRNYLTRSATEKIVHALISSRIDFGNALLYNLPYSQLTKLQILQNAPADIVTLSNKYSHITPVLETLHWLPIRERIIF